MLREWRRGRVQRMLAAATALSALPLGAEIYFEHFRGSFGDKWMWTPVVLSPALSAAGVAAMRSERAARTALPLVSALYCLDGLIGVYTHVQGVRKRPGGFSEPLYNIVMGPPPRVPVLAMVDEKLFEKKGEGYRHADMPADPQAWREVARMLDDAAAAQGAADFAAAGREAQLRIVARFSQGELDWDGLPVA